jgi:hypothetical protein
MRQSVFKSMMSGLCLLLLLPSASLAWNDTDNDRRPPEPPPEAYQACRGKEEGSRVTLKGPHGEIMKAECRQQGDRLVAVPTGRPPAQRGRD